MNLSYPRLLKLAALMLILLLALGASIVSADGPYNHKGIAYKVTIQNLTGGQPFTPPVVATHKKSTRLFEVGAVASFELKEIAENGNLAPMLDALANDGKVYAFEAGGVPGGPVLPGGSTTIMITADEGANRLSIASMLICTNDGFTGIDSVKLPKKGSVIYFTQAYDAGTEINTEDFADMVPPCPPLTGVPSNDPGTGASNPALAEGGIIQHHPGVDGVGVGGNSDMIPAIHDWDDPVAKITITVVADQAHEFLAPLSGDGEVPAVVTDASGRARFWLNYEQTELHYHLRVKDIDNVVASHIHAGTAGENGPVVALLFSGGPTGLVNGKLSSGIIHQDDLVGPFAGDFAGLVEALENGGLYVNVHTNPGFPSGEVRGQIGVVKR